MRVVSKRKKAVTIFFIMSAIASGGIAAGAYSLVRDLPNPERLTERSVNQSTRIYDRDGKMLLYEIHGEEKRTVIPFEDVPQTVKQATLVAEDNNFYSHFGIDIRGILRALSKNVIRGNLYYQGGSTITQQLVKNSILTAERTYLRKAREALLSLLVETKYSKDEIFELYLNQIPYGSNAYGVAAAADTYFGKKVDDLSLAEAAALAALTKAPTYYSPYGSHKNELTARSHWVLDRMAERGFISSEDAGGAKKTTLIFVPPRQSIRAPHFVMFIREYLNEKYGEEFVENGGLKIISTLDWKLQEIAERAVREGAEKNEKSVGAKNAALVTLDPKTGDILAMVGSRDYFDLSNDGNVNVATRPRQPGSAFKPFVYAAAFKKGLTPETVLMDVPTEFNPRCNSDGTPGPLAKDEKECYHPQNYDGTHRGPVTLRQSLAQSLNVPSVKLLYLTGLKESIEMARSLGISTLTDPDRYGLSLVLGGAEVKLLELVSSFGVFAQEGIQTPPGAILRIETAKGILLEEKKIHRTPILDTEIARTINNMLSDNDARIPVFHPRSSLFFPDRDVAVKTGTTQDYRDAWTAGYTPSLVAGVWVGNNDNSPMHHEGLSVMVAAPIWRAFMDAALASVPPEKFTPPESSRPEKPVLRGVYRSGPVIAVDKISKKLATSFTPSELVEEIGTGSITTILAVLKKEDPLGPSPENPLDDPQFPHWQKGIDEWLAKNPLPQPDIPKTFDDLHSPERRPSITLVSPRSDTSSVGTVQEITLDVKSFFPIQEIVLFIGEELVASKTFPIIPPRISFSLSTPLLPGRHNLKIIAYDSVGNKETVEETITINPTN